jgi:hypothetical protein
MPGINYVAVAVAAVAAFAVSFVYYTILGSQMRKLQTSPGTDATGSQAMPAWKMIAEVFRNLILAYVIAHLVVMIGITDWKSAIHWGLWLWLGFPLVLLFGSVLWENVPWKLAAIHAGDWFIKVLLGVWR